MATLSDEDLKVLLGRAASGEDEAVRGLWDYLYPKLKSIVLRQIATFPRLVGEASDLTSEALYGFICDTIRSSDIDLSDVNKVWGLIKLVAIRHINDVAKKRIAHRRGGLVETSSFSETDCETHCRSHARDFPNGKVSHVLLDDKTPDPIETILFEELVENLLAQLPSDLARQIVLMRLQNRTTGEIAELLQISIRTVQRQIKDIESIWQANQSSRE